MNYGGEAFRFERALSTAARWDSGMMSSSPALLSISKSFSRLLVPCSSSIECGALFLFILLAAYGSFTDKAIANLSMLSLSHLIGEDVCCVLADRFSLRMYV
jgi:hypothetical protein